MDSPLFAQSSVLVIDDPQAAGGYIKSALQELGFDDITHTGETLEAMQLIRANMYDVVLCCYTLRQEHDGYYLLEELKASQTLPSGTVFILTSSNTTSELINSIVELQPDDFLAKPFTLADLERRLTQLVKRKWVLRDVYEKLDQNQLEKALITLEVFLKTPANSLYFGHGLKIKGDILLQCAEYQQAQTFYEAILEVQNFTWAQVGLVSALMALDRKEEAEKYILQIAFQPETQLLGYDLIAKLKLQEGNYELALESTLLASEMSPINIHRQLRVIELSRITQDHKVQFEQAKALVRVSKKSMHDTPENYLRVVRAGIDYGLTVDYSESFKLLRQTREYLRQFENSTKNQCSAKSQLAVAKARILYLENNAKGALALLHTLENEQYGEQKTEYLLDKAKALHEVGLHKQSQLLFSEIEVRCKADVGKGKLDNSVKQRQLFLRYLQQEKEHRIAIKDSPRDLNNKAIVLFKKGQIKRAFDIFRQAFTVTPKNPTIALNLLQTIAADSERLSEDGDALISRCVQTLANSDLTVEQLRRYQKLQHLSLRLSTDSLAST